MLQQQLRIAKKPKVDIIIINYFTVLLYMLLGHAKSI